MNRKELLKKQYEERVASPEGGSRPMPVAKGRPPRPYRRSAFWRWFWLLFLITLLGGFFHWREDVFAVWNRMFDKDGGNRLFGSVPENNAIGDPYPTTQLGHSAGSLPETVVRQYFVPSEAELEQLFEYVRSSPHVKENLQYANTMKSVRFFYLGDDSTVNAFASLRKLDERSDELTRVICFFGGAARFSRVASLAVAAELDGDKGATARLINALTPADCGKMDDEAVVRIANAAGLGAALATDATRTKAKSVSAGMILGILAHESGHQSLGHVLNTGRSENLEISRNQEREADLFASSVISASPFGEYMFAGTLFWYYALATQEGGKQENTHPLSKERFENLVRSNPEKAAAMGVSLKE